MVTISNLGKNGQLGNQLWQIAAMVGYARKHGEVAFIKEWMCSYSKQDMTPFFPNIELIIAAGEKWNIKNVYKEPCFEYKEIPRQDDMDLSGYFQSPKYWNDYRDSIRNLFQPSKKLIEIARERYKNLGMLSSQVCSVHVRRKDYLNIGSHNVVSIPYYEKAMQYVREALPKNQVTFVVFSDDVEWCKKNFPKDCAFIEPGNNVEDLFLMSLCHHNIIANSTFSWWASWLNENPDKIVVAPDRWFNNGFADYKDVYADFMVQLDADGKSAMPVNIKKPKIAVLVYHKNVLDIYPKAWIDKFRDSILNQTYKDFDIFELDYGNTENKIFESSEFYNSEPHEKFVDALIRLIETVKVAGYDFIFNTNVDDYYSLDRIEKQLAKLKAGYDVVSSNFQLINEDNSMGKKTEFESLNIKNELSKNHNVIAHPVVAFKSSFFNDFHYNPGEIPKEDMLLWQRSIEKKKFIILPDNLLFHRLHHTSLSRSAKHPEQIKKGKIGILLISTNKYKQFVQPLINGIMKNFVKDSIISVHLFTDAPDGNYVGNERVQVHTYKIPPYGFPQATLYRYKIFDFFSPYLKEDYLFYMDMDMRIERDILAADICAEGKLTAVRHPGFYYNGGWGSPNTDERSMAYVVPERRKTYYAGGFQGGSSKLYIVACQILKHQIEIDEDRQVMAEWHDETHWNKLLNMDMKIHGGKIHELTPAFCHLDGVDMMTLDGSAKLDKKIVAINKNHKDVRAVV